MDKIAEVTLKTFSIFGYQITINPVTFLMTWLVMGLIIVFALVVKKKLKMIPVPIQGCFELVYEFLEDIVISTLGKKDGAKYVGLIVTLFIFVLLSNWIGIIPNIAAILGSFIGLIYSIVGSSLATISVEGLTNISLSTHPDAWFSFLFNIPAIEEPTKSVNTDLALAFVVFIVCHAFGIKQKGFIKYIRHFADDPFEMKGAWILFFFINPFFYLNIIGYIASIVSHSFRLFGNIFGGGMIIVIVSTLLKYFLIPVGLFAFFGLFAGLVQAFVFTMLAVTYIQQQQA